MSAKKPKNLNATLEALHASELRYRGLFESAKDGILILDAKTGIIVDVNPFLVELLGISRENLLDKKVWEIGLFKDIAANEEKFAKLQVPGKIRYDSLPLETAAGRSITVEFVGNVYQVNHQRVLQCNIRDITERKRAEAEEEQHSSQQILEGIVDAIPVRVFWKDKNLVYLGCNAAFAHDAGFANPKDLIGKNDYQMVWRDQAELYRSDDRHVIESGGSKYLIEEPQTTPEGNTITLLTSKIPLRSSNGEVRGMVGTYMDITERKQVEEDLRESKENLALALQASGMGVWRLDLREQKRYFDDQVCHCMGIEPACFTGTPEEFYAAVHPEDREILETALNNTITTGAPCEMEYRAVWPDGSLHFITARGQLARDAAGEPKHINGLLWDITGQKKAEQTLKRNQRNLTEAQRQTHIGSFEFDYQADFVEWSEEMYRICGIKKEDFQGKEQDFLSLIHPEDFEEVMKHRKEGFQVQGTLSFGFRIVRPNGETRFIWMVFETVFDEDGTPLRRTGTFQDITETKLAEEERSKLAAQLQQAQKMESVGRLAGGVAHDFNNMLGVILGHAELALQGVESEQPLHDNLMEIHKAAMRSADLTRQLLAFARKQTVAPRIMDLNQTVSNMLKMLQRLIGEDINLKWHPWESLWQVKIDPNQIDQILANLCVNARDAITDGGKIIIETGNSTLGEDYCTAHIGSVPGEYVTLTVSDDGCGMDKETLAQIFEPFFTTKGLGEGTGLGLSTVYGIVKQNNGFINVYSEMGHGTTFTIYLPRHEGKTDQTAGTAGSAEPLHGYETVLLVEDDPSLLKLTARMIEKQGYTVLVASAPGEALHLADEYGDKISLLMTDVVMPGMNGRDLAKNLVDLIPNLRLLFMSGYTADVIAQNGVLEEGVHFIQKPFSVQSLATKLREALDSV